MEPSSDSEPQISLLLATYHNPVGAGTHLSEWIRLATKPESVEGLIAGDDSDPELARLKSAPYATLISPGKDSASSAVRNWNLAASHASGRLLFVIADDLHATAGWDEKLLEVFQGLDPRKVSFGIKVADFSGDRSTLMRHPVVSRKFYETLGLFDSRYDGVSCDLDISRRAFWRAFVIDGTSAVFEHRHPVHDNAVRPSRSQELQNRTHALDVGRSKFRKQWPFMLREPPIYLLPAVPKGSTISRRVRVHRLRARSLSAGVGIFFRLGRRKVCRIFWQVLSKLRP